MQSVLHATLNFLRQEEQRQEPLGYWTMDMDLLRASFEGGQCGDQKTVSSDLAAYHDFAWNSTRVSALTFPDHLHRSLPTMSICWRSLKTPDTHSLNS